MTKEEKRNSESRSPSCLQPPEVGGDHCLLPSAPPPWLRASSLDVRDTGRGGPGGAHSQERTRGAQVFSGKALREGAPE